jgi:hypothetical protein
MRIVITLVLSISCLTLFSPSTHALDGNQLLEEIDRNLAPVSYEMFRKLINIEPDGSKREYTLYTIKKDQDKIISIFLAPASEKGRSTLRLAENMWLHIPNVGKPVRITSLQSVIGGIFNNSDIMGLDFSVEYNVERMEDAGEAHMLFLKAKSDVVAYDRLEMRVDKKSLVPVEIKCLAASGMLIKTLYFKEITDFGEGLVRPAVIETDSPLNKGYKSLMVFAKVKKREFPDEIFTLNYLPRAESLRQ